MKTKMYNTWSCRGFLTEGLIPIQVARGSHEDKDFKGKFCVVRDDTTIMSFSPSVKFWAKTWLPNQEIVGSLVPHGEAYSIHEYLKDKETGYAPSQYYVYDFNTYAKIFVMNLPKDATVKNTKPVMEVIHPMNHPSLRGVDKVGALMVMKNNRGWWTGTIMDDVDCRDMFNGKFGPTVLQVAAGAWAGFLWACKNPNAGTRFPENTDTDFVLK